MTETFNYRTRVGTSGEIAQRVWGNDFGDGYAQSGGTGINTRSQSWELSLSGTLKEGSELLGVRDFLDRQEGYKAFIWTPPAGSPGRYKANGYKLNTLGAGLYSLSVSLKQVFVP